MSDLPLPDMPTPPRGNQFWDARSDDRAVVERARSRLLRVAWISVIVVAVLGVAGVAVIATQQTRTVLISVSVAVVVGCVLVVLVAALSVIPADRALRQLRLAPPPPARIVHAAPSPQNHAAFGHDLDQRRQVFVKVARRLQSLINRAIRRVDELERELEDPELLKGLYEVDHLATRVRRQAENLAVLGGEAPQRRSSTPVSVYAVLRSAVAEVEHYKQVTIVPTEGVELHGHAVAEIIHLLAELLENATTFTAPDSSKVVLRAQTVTAGLAIEVQDRGLGIRPEDLFRINRFLDRSTQIDVGELLQDGRIGLAVVKELSRRHNVRVQLQLNIFGGINAAVVVPHSLISDSARAAMPARQSPPLTPGPEATPAPEAGAITTSAPTGQTEPGFTTGPALTQSDERHTSAVEIAPVSGDPDLARGQQGATPAPQLPALPVRTANAPANSAPPPAADPAPADPSGRPPLPQRRGQTHLREELLAPLAAPTRPTPGHNTSLMASVQKGLDRGRNDQDGAMEPPHPESQPQHGVAKESNTWPTI